MPAFRRRLIQALAVLGALTVLAGIGFGVWLGVDQVRQYIAEQDQRIAGLTARIESQQFLITQQQGRIRTQAGDLVETKSDVERLRSGLGTLQNVTANQHSYVQLDITDLQNSLGALRTFTSGHQVDTSFELASLRSYIDRVDQAAIDADYGQDQRLASAERMILAVERDVQAVEGDIQTVATKVADLSLQRIADRSDFNATLAAMPSERITAGLLPAWLLMLSTEWGGILGEDGQADTVRVRWSSNLDDKTLGDYNPNLHLIRVDEELRGERPELLAALLAHEFQHAASPIAYPRTYAECLQDELRSTLYEVSVWNDFDLAPQTDAERKQQAMLDTVRRLRPADDTLPLAQWTALLSYLEDDRGYRERCSTP